MARLWERSNIYIFDEGTLVTDRRHFPLNLLPSIVSQSLLPSSYFLHCCRATTRSNHRKAQFEGFLTKSVMREKINSASPTEENLDMVIGRRKATHCIGSVNTACDYSSFTMTADAKIHRRIICRASWYSSNNNNVSLAQTGQVVGGNANCFTGWQPCNLQAGWQRIAGTYTFTPTWESLKP